LDAASGYVPTWHMLPEILAWDGYDVTACDWDERSLSMPHGNLGVGIVRPREIGNITSLPYDDKSFDCVCCISVLEHLPEAAAYDAAKEFVRVARKQILLTADDGWWLPHLFGLPVVASANIPLQPALTPAVYTMNILLEPNG
jgi:hypothetical protein